MTWYTIVVTITIEFMMKNSIVIIFITIKSIIIN